MPATSAAQERLMQCAAHTPGGCGGVPQSVGKEFIGKDDVPATPAGPSIPVATSDASQFAEPTVTPAAVAPIDPKAGPSGRAAGILFTTPEGEMLFMHRGDGGDYPRTWGLPGGHQMEGETLEDCARREAEEETGLKYDGPLRKIYDDGQFATYAAEPMTRFDVKMCDESVGFTWSKAPPEPAHPGLSPALRVNAMQTEMDAAELMREGVLPSPFIYGNIYLVALRITGTGAAYRTKNEEHVWRDPSLYLNDEFLRRCNGLPVILDHPETAILTSDEFEKRICGACMLPYIKGDEVWAIARIYAQDAIKQISEAVAGDVEISTSPSVLFTGDSENVTVTLEDGKHLLIEGKPALLDHIALVTENRGARGVWDKGGPATGVSLNNEEMVMADDDKKADDMKKADAAGGEIADKLLAAVDALSKRMDDMHKRMDEMAVADKKKADDDAKKDDAKKDDAKKDDAKKDDDDAKAKKDEDDKKADDAKCDDDDDGKYADAQASADRIYAAFGDRAPRPLAGEGLLAYRRRLASKYQAHSPTYKDINLRAINDAALFAIAEKQIYADAVTASRNPTSFGENQLIEVKRSDATGRQISTFHGSPDAWMAPFRATSRRVHGFNKGN